MKRFNLMLGAALIAAGFTSCKNDAEMAAQDNVDKYEAYVDSIQGLDDDERVANWETIDSEYNNRLSEAESGLESVKDRAAAEEKINDTKEKYNEVKNKTMEEANDAKEASLYNGLFGHEPQGGKMDFTWVNKDNILGVYKQFVETFEANKDNYTRDQLDMIKAWYEALDARKNTVEEQGLTTEDNMEIAKLKTSFATKFAWERMTAKGEENEEAKEAAE